MDIENLSKEYYNHFLSTRSGVGDDGRNFESEIHEIVTNPDPILGYDFIKSLVSMGSDSEYLFYVGAGPLEDWLAFHGAAALEIISNAFEKGDKLHTALSGVWQNKMSDQVYSALQLLISGN